MQNSATGPGRHRRRRRYGWGRPASRRCFQVGPHGPLGNAEAADDLHVGAPSRQVFRGRHNHRRLPGTTETSVVVLITQRRQEPMTAEVTATTPHDDSPRPVTTAIHGKAMASRQVAALN